MDLAPLPKHPREHRREPSTLPDQAELTPSPCPAHGKRWSCILLHQLQDSWHGSSWGLHWITPASPSSTQGSHGAAPQQRMQAGQTQDTCREYKRKGLVWNRDGGRSPTRTHFCYRGILSLEPLNIPLLCSTTVGPLTPGSRLHPHFTEWLCSLFRRRSGSNPV